MRHRLAQQRLAIENMIRGLLRVYDGRVEPGAKSSATYRDRVVEQLLIIHDREDINLRPRIEENVFELVAAREAIGDFRSMIRSKSAAKLDDWIEMAKGGLVGSFVDGDGRPIR